MKNQDFKISSKIVWLLVLGDFLFIILGALAKIQHWRFSDFLLSTGLVLLLSGWIIIFNDMIKNKISNKPFWILSMFIMPVISPIFYLLQSNRLKKEKGI
ncbi:PLDc N-terminal domain-containing protein [Psychroflexus salinarum]|uniref:PLDc N-terminal domain-containing protein n=1 Tax=Psychroflexus salinarum TaxID=546024 RepID=A0ABW3GLK7_9FLAO